MNLNKVLFLPILFLLFNCNQKQEKTENRIHSESELKTQSESETRNYEKYVSELKTQSESETRNYEKYVSEFALNFTPKGTSALDSIPENIIKGFRELRTIDKSAHEKYLTLIFTKLYAEHLQCCHQSYIIEHFPADKTEYDFDKLTMVNEFAFMSNYLDNEKLPEIWTSGIIEKWLAENPELLEFEPIGKYNQFIKTASEKIKNGDYWNN
ncbi:hypothetical protein [Nonlabens sp. SY33080]|uniref:hypothetical protein n=1 Tax=Nonlabens sp. SY33080 TaxID=2719911 RepID=UPI001428A49E|nr:hypothetical protein [Nonlabens sp. SY33080]